MMAQVLLLWAGWHYFLVRAGMHALLQASRSLTELWVSGFGFRV